MRSFVISTGNFVGREIVNQIVHVFSGHFASRQAACLYTEEQWEPEPDDSVSDEVYEAWEARNPTWALRDDLNIDRLDSDFVETITGNDRMTYLEGLLTSDRDRETLRQSIPSSDNTLVLISEATLDGQLANFTSTAQLQYFGAYPCNI